MLRFAFVAACLTIVSRPTFAQTSLEDERQTASPPQQIDILVSPRDGGYDPLAQEQCEEAREGTVITGEIVVCRDLSRGSTDGAWHRQGWERDYARETAYADDPQAPDVAGAGIFRGPASISGLCILNKCPPPPAILIDVEALPLPPEDSDADRIARGLAPRGDEGELSDEARSLLEAELGLPPPPDR